MLLICASFAIAAVNINTATKEELDALPGIGPVKAQAIVDYRKANGPFKSLDDLKKVKGIGDVTYDKLKPDISLTGATTPVAAPAKAEPAKMAAPAAAACGCAKDRADEVGRTCASACRCTCGACRTGKGRTGEDGAPAAPAAPAKAEPPKTAAPAAAPAPAAPAAKAEPPKGAMPLRRRPQRLPRQPSPSPPRRQRP